MAAGYRGPATRIDAMNHAFARRLAALVLASLSFGLCAQDLPWPKEFYFEPDTDVARPLELYPGSDDATVERLLPDWTDEDRAVLARVAEAWKLAPPPWP